MILLSIIPFATFAANFPGAFPTRNEKLREQVAQDPDRILPKTNYFSAAVDADFFKPAYVERKISERYSANPYHGNGYWIESRFERVPIESIRLNVKLIPWFGTSSFGYSARSQLFSLAAGSWEDQLFRSDWKFRFRVSDLELQTFGGGLIIQDRPVNGGRSEFEHGDILLRFTVDGTGGLTTPGDTYDHHIGLFHDRLGVGVI